jgi:hypothetical protein
MIIRVVIDVADHPHFCPAWFAPAGLFLVCLGSVLDLSWSSESQNYFSDVRVGSFFDRSTMFARCPFSLRSRPNWCTTASDVTANKRTPAPLQTKEAANSGGLASPRGLLCCGPAGQQRRGMSDNYFRPLTATMFNVAYFSPIFSTD